MPEKMSRKKCVEKIGLMMVEMLPQNLVLCTCLGKFRLTALSQKRQGFSRWFSLQTESTLNN